MVTNAVCLLVCIATVISVAYGDCLNGWTRFDDSCYHLFHGTFIWIEAQFECEKHDAFLAMIETKQESVNIHAYMKELNLGENDHIWIGLADVRLEGHWVWENSKQNATFFDWGPNEPDQKGPDVSVQQDCVILYGKVGHQWADIQCDQSNFVRNYLCERPLQAPALV